MRILNVAQTYYPYLAEGGRPAKVRVLSRKLAERGHDVTVLTANLGTGNSFTVNGSATGTDGAVLSAGLDARFARGRPARRV